MKKHQGVLQTLPLLCLAVCSLFVGSFAYKWGTRTLSEEKMQAISGGSGPPTAIAKAQNVTTTAIILKRQLVQFDGSASTGGNLGYSWTFGDGGTSTASMPTRRYTGTGTYTATLTVTNSYGQHSDTVDVKGYVPYVTKVGFKGGDYRMQKIKLVNGVPTRVTIGYDDSKDPVWDMMVVSPYTSMDSGDTNDEVAYLKNAAPTLFKVVLWAGESPTTNKNLSQPANVALDTVGTGSLDFNATSIAVQNWPSSEFSLSPSAGGDDKFYNYIYRYNPFTLQWTYQNNGDTQTVPMSNNTTHKIFLLYTNPRDPWHYFNNPPWVEVLDKSCQWASGDATESAAAQHITESAYSSSGKQYDPSKTHALGTSFNLTAFLADNWADCRDMSAWVHVLTASVGLISQARRIDGPFTYKEILPVGLPQWESNTWNFHQVGWWNSKVYDACLKYDQNPPNHVGKVPVNMDINGNYKTAIYLSGTWNTSSGAFYYTTVY